MKRIMEGKEILLQQFCLSQTSPALLVLSLRPDPSRIKPIRLGGMPQEGQYLQVSLPQYQLYHGKLRVSKLLWMTRASWPLHQHQGRTKMQILMTAKGVMSNNPVLQQKEQWPQSQRHKLNFRLCHSLAACFCKCKQHHNQKTNFPLSG